MENERHNSVVMLRWYWLKGACGASAEWLPDAENSVLWAGGRVAPLKKFGIQISALKTWPKRTIAENRQCSGTNQAGMGTTETCTAFSVLTMISHRRHGIVSACRRNLTRHTAVSKKGNTEAPKNHAPCRGEGWCLAEKHTHCPMVTKESLLEKGDEEGR